MIKKHAFVSSLIILLVWSNFTLSQEEQPIFFPHKDAPNIDSQKSNDYIQRSDNRNVFNLYDVINYVIEMQIYPDSQVIRGKTRIDFSATGDITDYIAFDFSGLELDSVIIAAEKVTAIRDSDVVLIPLINSISRGDTQSVELYYSGSPDKGIYFRESYTGDLVIYSHNEPFDARYWFPCKDDPSDKAFLDLKIIAPNGYTVLSNGRLIETSAEEPGWKRWHWRTVNPIVTYLISLAAAPYVIVEETFIWENINMPLQYYVYAIDYEKGEAALTATRDMLSFFSNYIGVYPFLNEKYAMSEVPFREASAMENQTATTMSEFVMDNKNVIAHELAHQWWGDAVTPYSFSDIWLNEGFASYFDALYTEYKYGSDAFQEQMILYKSVIGQDGSLEYPIYNPPSQYWFGKSVYYKGAWVLHMLRYMVGDSVFNDICRTYYDYYKYRNVTSGDFIQICELQSGRSLSAFFYQWLYFGGIPILMGEWEQNGGTVNIVLRQTQVEPVYYLDVEVLLQGVERDTLIVLPMSSNFEKLVITFSSPVVQMKIDPQNKILNRNNGPLVLIPRKTQLNQVFPNPFNEMVTISYQVHIQQKIELSIYNILGEKVITLVQDCKNTGFHMTSWRGDRCSSGTYYCVLKTADGMSVKKIVLLK